MSISSFHSLLLKAELAGTDAFWPSVAQQVIDIAQQHGTSTQLGNIQVVLAQGSHAAALRTALWRRLRQTFIPPRVLLWSELAGQQKNEQLARRAQLFDVLRANPWIRIHFGAQPSALWALAQQVEALSDELTYAALNRGHELKREDIETALQRHYRQRAARVLLPQARLVLDLWKAGGDAGAAERVDALNRWAERADRTTNPLVLVASTRIEPWVRAWFMRYSIQTPVLLIEPDVVSVLRNAPLLAAAWPELAEEASDRPLAARADALRAQADLPAPALKILRTYSLEEEAEAVARHVLEVLQQGASSIALVPLDRLTARRVRALLERAQVQVRDETGWKLSTTSAAAALMRWFDVVADDFYWRDVLDWLKSTFTLADRPHKAKEIAVFEHAVRAAGALQGANAMRAALQTMNVNEQDGAAHSGALEILSVLHTQAQRSARAGPSVAAHLRELQSALDALGMRAALGADAVGRAVLREIDILERELGATSTRATLADFRALLATRFEESTFVDAEVQSPVVMVSLAATVLRAFDHAVLIGADASHLPSLGEPTLFMSNAVRGELGLSTRESMLHEQAQQLALLLHNVSHVVATWRVQRNGEPNALSPWLERLRFVTQRAYAQDLCLDVIRPAFAVNAHAQVRPAPAAGALLPRHVSASQAQSLTQCPYQFYARTLLGLRELEDLIEMPDKRDFGDALHEVLRRFHSAWGAAPFHEQAAAEIAASLREHARSVFEPQLARTPALLSFARRFDGLVPGYVMWLQQQYHEGWRWQAGELKQSRALPLHESVSVELRGRIDRVDQHPDGRVQVIDYKARAVNVLKDGLKQPGEDIQLPFYGALLEQTAQEAQYLSFDRAKEGEPGVESVKPPQPFEDLTAAVLNRLHQDLQRVASDAPLPAIGPDSVCAHCEMRGLCRRDYWELDE